MSATAIKAVIVAAGLPEPIEEYRVVPYRRWRFDFCWPERSVALEIDGGLYVHGRHSRGAGREKDLEKIAEAICAGWRVLVVSPRMVKDGRMLAWLERLLK